MKKKLEESKTQREEIKNLKKEKRELTKKKTGEQWEADSRFGGAATNKNGAAPEQLEPIHRADEATT